MLREGHFSVGFDEGADFTVGSVEGDEVSGQAGKYTVSNVGE